MRFHTFILPFGIHRDLTRLKKPRFRVEFILCFFYYHIEDSKKKCVVQWTHGTIYAMIYQEYIVKIMPEMKKKLFVIEKYEFRC